MEENMSEIITGQVDSIFQNLELSKQCQIYNEGIAGTINQYKQELCRWYDGQSIKENGFTTTTQSLWYCHFLNKKRIEHHQIGIHYEMFQSTMYPRMGDAKLPFFSYAHDGKNMVCNIKDNLHYRKVWYRNGQILWVDQPNGKEGEYNVIQSKAVNGHLICPNCGHEDTAEAMIDGCDYCKTKFNMEDFNQKVTSLYEPRTAFSTRDNNPVKKMFIPILFIFGGGFLTMMSVGSAFFFIILLITILGTVISIAVLTVQNDKKGAARNTITKDKIRRVDPQFSEEFFLGNLESRITAIHYADQMQNIKAFVCCDIQNYLNQYRDVIECTLDNYLLVDYRTDAQWQYMDVDVAVNLKKDVNGIIKEEQEKIHINMVKSIEAKTGMVNDAVVYTCKGCGASLSLLNGGKCEFCDRELNLAQYDWVINGYRVDK